MVLQKVGLLIFLILKEVSYELNITRKIQELYIPNYLRSSNIATSWTKAFSKGSHVNINIHWITSIVINYASTSSSQSTYAVSFINIEICLKQKTIMYIEGILQVK